VMSVISDVSIIKLVKYQSAFYDFYTFYGLWLLFPVLILDLMMKSLFFGFRTFVAGLLL
jgi:uncharacterized membrane protein